MSALALGLPLIWGPVQCSRASDAPRPTLARLRRARLECSRARPPAHLGLTALLGFGSILHLPAIGWSMALIVVAWMMTYVRALGRHSA